MSQAEEQLEALKDIRKMMERSTRFLSLNGLSGIFVGLIALAGAAAAHWFLTSYEGEGAYYEYAVKPNGMFNISLLGFLIADGISVLVLSLITATALTIRKAHKNGEKVWTTNGRRLMYNMAIPLVSGGLFCIIMTLHGYAAMVAPAMLIFYGLALVNASKYTYEHVIFLGLTEIVLGILCAVFLYHGLLFWSLGFGVVHILYGIIAWFTFEKKA